MLDMNLPPGSTWEEHTSAQRVLRSSGGAALFIDHESQFCGDTRKGRVARWQLFCRLDRPATVIARILLDGVEIPGATVVAEPTPWSDRHFTIFTKAPIADDVVMDRLDFVLTIDGEG